MRHQGQKLTSGEVPRLEVEKQRLMWREVFDWIDRKLRSQATSAQCGRDYQHMRSFKTADRQDRPWKERGRSPERRDDRRRTRSISLESSDSDEAEIAVAKGKSRSKSAPPRPEEKPKGETQGKAKSTGKERKSDKGKESTAKPAPAQVPEGNKGKGDKGGREAQDWRTPAPVGQGGRGKSQGAETARPAGECWNCGAPDHWRVDCPFPRKERGGSKGGTRQ